MQPNPNPHPTADSEVEASLGLGRTRRPRWIAWVLWALVAVALLWGVSAWRARNRAAQATQYVTTPVKRGDVTVTVTATGTLQALDSVDVSSEVSGRVVAVLADFNDHVKQGQVLVRLDPQQAKARADEAAAQVSAARAAVVRAQATDEQTAVKLKRQRQLAADGLISPDDLDTAVADANRSQADLGSARAQLTVSQANFTDAQTALSKTTVLSPVDGVVISRSIEPGQTVAASLSAPVLFSLAKDLTQMTLHVNVDEADVGKVHEGEHATFSVDAYPDRTFQSVVTQLRNVAKTDQNVVTYEAVLSVDNHDLLLRPGMTGTALIRADEKQNALLVPNTALRFTPPDVLAQQGPAGGLFIPGVTKGNPFGRQGQRQGSGQGGAGAGAGGGGQGAGARGGRAQGGGGQGSGAQGGGAAGNAPAGAAGAPAGSPGTGRPGGQGAGSQGGQAGSTGGAEPGPSPGAPGRAGGRNGAGQKGGAHGTPSHIWLLEAGKPVQTMIGAGATDGQQTEVLWGKLKEGDLVITDVATSKESGG